MYFKTRRTRSITIQEWTNIVLSWRKETIDRLLVNHGFPFVEEALRLYRKRDVKRLDAELTRLGYPP
jgi:hypothetical protein